MTEKRPNHFSPWAMTYKSVLVCQRNLTLSTSVKTLYNIEKMPTSQHSSKWNSLNFLKPCFRFTESNQDPTWSIFPTKLEKHWSDPIPFSLFIPNCIVLVQSLILCSFIVSIASLLVFIPQILPISYNIHAVAWNRFSSRSICSFHFHTI